MPRIYRVMKEDQGKPMVGASATTLGVRVPTDIAPDAAGDVHSATGGMSVSPSLRALPARLIPRRLRHMVPRAAGNDRLLVWSMGDGPFVQEPIAPRLQLRPDPHNSRHGLVEPDASMSLDDYRAALAATQNEWSVDEK
jgi:hypothetical protein